MSSGLWGIAPLNPWAGDRLVGIRGKREVGWGDVGKGGDRGQIWEDRWGGEGTLIPKPLLTPAPSSTGDTETRTPP